MTKEDKDLLLKDLCARLTYGIKVHLETPKYGELIGTLDAVYPTDDRVIVDNLSKAIAPINVRTGGFLIGEDNVKPFLRPMSSMTEEEVTELAYKVFQQPDIDIVRRWVFENKLYPSIDGNPAMVIDWLNAHHFDYRGLIEKGLALEATSETYNKQ